MATVGRRRSPTSWTIYMNRTAEATRGGRPVTATERAGSGQPNKNGRSSTRHLASSSCSCAMRGVRRRQLCDGRVSRCRPVMRRTPQLSCLRWCLVPPPLRQRLLIAPGCSIRTCRWATSTRLISQRQCTHGTTARTQCCSQRTARCSSRCSKAERVATGVSSERCLHPQNQLHRQHSCRWQVAEQAPLACW